MNRKQIEATARLAHEVNRAYAASMNEPQPSWEDAPEWQKDSAINGVKFHLENPDVTPEELHVNWMAEKIKSGWVYGPEKDPEKKTHPCLLPYAALGPFQQTKDVLFGTVVSTMSSVFGSLDDAISSSPTVGEPSISSD